MSRTLPREDMERYAQLRARGTSGTEAVRVVLGNHEAARRGDNACKALAWRLNQLPKVQARIDAITAELRSGTEAMETITARTVTTLMAETIEALEATSAALARVGADASTRNAMRKMLVTVIGRARQLRQPVVAPPKVAPSKIDMAAALRPCRCGGAPCPS